MVLLHFGKGSHNDIPYQRQQRRECFKKIKLLNRQSSLIDKMEPPINCLFHKDMSTPIRHNNIDIDNRK